MRSQPGPGGPAPDSAERQRRLLGATIDPAVASAILADMQAEHEPIKFDGFGRITGIESPEGRPLPASLIDRLERAVIKPLTHTNSPAPRDAPRAERELLVRALHVLRMHGGAEHAALFQEARQLFLSGAFSRESVVAFLGRGAKRLADDVLIRDLFGKLQLEAAKPVTMTQRADNLYGRTFESLLVEDLVLDPLPGVLKAAAELGQGMLDTLNAMPADERNALMQEFVKVLSEDVRPWYGHSPSMRGFAASPSMQTLAACLADTSNGLEAVKMVNLAQRFVFAINNASERQEMARPRWYSTCMNFYSNVLFTQKPQARTGSNVKAGNPGNWLRHQPNVSTISNPITGINWTHYRMPDPNKLSLFEEDALLRGQSVINGASGQTCMVSFFGQQLAGQNPALSLGNLHLATLMALVFDGGHSTEEVLFTVDTLKPFYSPEAVSPGWSSGFRGGYEAIAELGDTPAERQALRDRMDKAVDRTLQYYANHVA